jgi:hypothetical protein
MSLNPKRDSAVVNTTAITRMRKLLTAYTNFV